MSATDIDRIEAMAIAWEATSTLALADLADSLIQWWDCGCDAEVIDLLHAPDRRPPVPPAELVQWVRTAATVKMVRGRAVTRFKAEHNSVVERVVGAFDIRTSTARRLVTAALDGWEPT